MLIKRSCANVIDGEKFAGNFFHNLWGFIKGKSSLLWRNNLIFLEKIMFSLLYFVPYFVEKKATDKKELISKLNSSFSLGFEPEES